MKINGQIVTAQVSDQNDQFIFVQVQGETLAVDPGEFEQAPSVGEEVVGIAYEDVNGRERLTTKLPTVGYDHYAFATVVSVRRDLGVFVDIGLPDKDIVVSLDQLPEIHALWPSKGDRLMVSLVIDSKHRLWGKLADESIIQAIAKRAKASQMNDNVEATVYRLKLAGTRVITSDYDLGFIHPNERDREPRLGEVVHARVIGVSPEGQLNLSLKPRAFEAIGPDAEMLLAVLKREATHTIPYTDKSNPDAIKEAFGISKGAFKRALGHLMKAGLISQQNGVTKLLKTDDE